jgi:hypothetical protein
MSSNFPFNAGMLFSQQEPILDKQGRIKFDPFSGGMIDPSRRIFYKHSNPFKSFKQNPYGITRGNAINPNIDYSPLNNMANILAPAEGFSLLRRQNGI